MKISESQRIVIANTLIDIARAVRRDTLESMLDSELAIEPATEDGKLRLNIFEDLGVQLLSKIG